MSFQFFGCQEGTIANLDTAKINTSSPIDELYQAITHSSGDLIISPNNVFTGVGKTYIITQNSEVNLALFTKTNLDLVPNWRNSVVKTFQTTTTSNVSYTKVAPSDPNVAYYLHSNNNYTCGTWNVLKNGDGTYTMWYVGATF
jgi:hypothetical protein